MQAQPLIATHDVPATSVWYQTVLGLHSGHGGDDYDQLLNAQGGMVLQLHRWDAHEHAHIGNSQLSARGNGVLLWFQTDAFDAAVTRALDHGAKVLEGPKLNPNAQHRELWLQDPNGYVVVIAGAYGDLGERAPVAGNAT